MSAAVRTKGRILQVSQTNGDLPREVIEATTVNGFKGKLDKHRERREL